MYKFLPILCALVAPMYVGALELNFEVEGPQKAFHFSPHKEFWEKTQATVNDKFEVHMYKHVHANIFGVICYQPLLPIQIKSCDDTALHEMVIQGIEQNLPEGLIDTKYLESIDVQGSTMLLAKMEVRSRDSEGEKTMFIDSMVFKGENYIIINMVTSMEHSQHDEYEEHIAEFLKALKITRDVV